MTLDVCNVMKKCERGLYSKTSKGMMMLDYILLMLRFFLINFKKISRVFNVSERQCRLVSVITYGTKQNAHNRPFYFFARRYWSVRYCRSNGKNGMQYKKKNDHIPNLKFYISKKSHSIRFRI